MWVLLKRTSWVVLAGLALVVSSLTASFTALGESADAPEVSFTGSAEAGTGSAEFRIGYYDNSDSGDGNPFLDEELTVVEPIFIVDYNITDRLAAWGQFSYDYVSSASIERLDSTGIQSGASGDNYFGYDFGARYELDEDRRVGGFFTISTEYDYDSYGLGGDFARDFANKDATVKISLNGYYDEVDVIRFDGSEEGIDDRVSLSTTVSWYQILNPRTHAEMGGTFGYQHGFLETAYNAVVIEDPTERRNPNLDNRARGFEITEELPATRLRWSLFGRTRYSLMPSTALEIGGRLYIDSWGIFGFTAEPRLHHWLNDTLGFRLGYRYYTQTAADDYDDHFTDPVDIPARRTQDSDLADFDSHGLYGAVLWQPFETLSLDLTAGYTFREDGIDQLTLSFGVRQSFDTRWLSKYWDRMSDR